MFREGCCPVFRIGGNSSAVKGIFGVLKLGFGMER